MEIFLSILKCLIWTSNLILRLTIIHLKSTSTLSQWYNQILCVGDIKKFILFNILMMDNKRTIRCYWVGVTTSSLSESSKMENLEFELSYYLILEGSQKIPPIGSDNVWNGCGDWTGTLERLSLSSVMLVDKVQASNW